MFSWLDICSYDDANGKGFNNYLKPLFEMFFTRVSPSFQIYHACVEAMSNEVYVLLWVNHLNEWVKSKQKVFKTWIPQTQHTGHNYTEHNTISVWKSSLVLLAVVVGGWRKQLTCLLFVVTAVYTGEGGQVSRVRSVWSPRAGAMLWTWKQ